MLLGFLLLWNLEGLMLHYMHQISYYLVIKNNVT